LSLTKRSAGIFPQPIQIIYTIAA
jgi:hypothetical protein